jgi:ABC-type lipoprotein export system ATPase subunit
MLQTKNLSFFYNKDTQFLFPDLNCDASQTLLITGNSGKGKTTLLHLLAGLLLPKKGEIQINQTQVSSLSDKNLDQFRGKNIGLILQQSHFIASLTVLENVVLASWLASGKKAIEKANQLLDDLDLNTQKHKLPSQLSIGQQQRVSIARALINEPKVVLADEPTSSLDDENAFKVADLLEKLAKQYHAALVIVTHDLRLKNKFSNQINLN